MQESMPCRSHAPAAGPGWGLHYLMCPPTYFGVLYSINPWMDPAQGVDSDLAESQWNHLAGMIQAAGARIERITPISGRRRMLARLVPDLVPLTPEETALFCANSLVIGRTVIMPACTARLGQLLEQRGFDVAVADVGEFIKAGGGCRCLTLALDTVLSRPAEPHPVAGLDRGASGRRRLHRANA